MPRNQNSKSVEALRHTEASRRNLPSGEHQSLLDDEASLQSAFRRRNRDLDPQLVWRGKDERNASELVVRNPQLYIQERIHPKALIDDLMQLSRSRQDDDPQPDLFADFNGLPHAEAKTEFYAHEAHWTNRMILGDSLQVMASLAEREGLRGQVQCIYVDPPYGIRFNSNFQWSTTSRTVQDGKREHITREPEQVKAFRDTWQDGIHSYLTYLRDRFVLARELLADTGSIFVQIGDENVHRVRAVMDEVFGDKAFVSLITCRTSSGTTQQRSVKRVSDYIIWYAKDIERMKFRRLLQSKRVDTQTYNQLELKDGSRRAMTAAEKKDPSLCPDGSRPYRKLPLHSMASGDHAPRRLFKALWRIPPMRSWRYAPEGFENLAKAGRIQPGKTVLESIYYHNDYPAAEVTNSWDDTGPEIQKSYVVQTSTTPIQRCILMTTDPGDLVLDPTCGSGTTAYVAEKWGRRWITIDTSRVALALARIRLMGARYPYFLLSDSREGQLKEAELNRTEPSANATQGNVRHGFVNRRVPHVMLRDISNNAEIEEIWDDFQERLEPLRAQLNQSLDVEWEEWEVPAEGEAAWPVKAKRLHLQWRKQRKERQKKIEKSISAQAAFEFLYDQPFEDKSKVRVAGPFTVETVSPHRMLTVDEQGEFTDPARAGTGPDGIEKGFVHAILESLKASGVQQVHREDRIEFTRLEPWPGDLIGAEGRYQERTESAEGAIERRAAVFIGPEFSTVARTDLVEAAREAAENAFDVLIACAFNYDAHATELQKLGRLPILKARMNADLHMADVLHKAGRANLFVLFGEPDIEIQETADNQLQVQVKGVDVFHPNTGQIHSDGPEGIACWFVDTHYDRENFFVRQAYFLGAKDSYKALKTTLKKEIDKEAWTTLYSDTSRPFDRPSTHRIAVKVINHLGDEVMKVFRVDE